MGILEYKITQHVCKYSRSSRDGVIDKSAKENSCKFYNAISIIIMSGQSLLFIFNADL